MDWRKDVQIHPKTKEWGEGEMKREVKPAFPKAHPTLKTKLKSPRMESKSISPWGEGVVSPSSGLLGMDEQNKFAKFLR